MNIKKIYFLLILYIANLEPFGPNAQYEPNIELDDDINNLDLQSSSNKEEPKIVYVNIFIHGTTRPHLSVNNIRAIWRQEGIEKSAYATITRFMRERNLPRKYQAIQELGLKKVTTNGAAAVATAMDYFIKKDHPEQEHKYFTFGWSGILGPGIRKRAGKKLYKALQQLTREANIKNKKLFFRVFGFSHGGTVALFAAKEAARSKRTQKIYIDELVTLGMPVQYDTDYLVNSPLFKKVYHFYSMSDYVQPLDHISSKHFACHRRFASRKNFIVPKKLKQINIEVTKTVLSQYMCSTKPEKQKIFKIHKLNPGHSELWNTGWAPSSVRRNFPLYPLPVVAITPHIIDKINNLPERTQDFKANINPVLNRTEITECFKRGKKCIHRFPFIRKEEFDSLACRLEKEFKPQEDLVEEYNALVKEGIKHANMRHNICDFGMCTLAC